MATIKYHTEKCDRCDGTGKHSYNPMHGRACFKCKGGGRMRSALGRAARESVLDIYRREMSIPAYRLRVGDRVILPGTKRMAPLIRARQSEVDGMMSLMTEFTAGADFPADEQVIIWDVAKWTTLLPEIAAVDGADVVD